MIILFANRWLSGESSNPDLRTRVRFLNRSAARPAFAESKKGTEYSHPELSRWRKSWIKRCKISPRKCLLFFSILNNLKIVIVLVQLLWNSICNYHNLNYSLLKKCYQNLTKGGIECQLKGRWRVKTAPNCFIERIRIYYFLKHNVTTTNRYYVLSATWTWRTWLNCSNTTMTTRVKFLP